MQAGRPIRRERSPSGLFPAPNSRGQDTDTAPGPTFTRGGGPIL